MSAVAVLACSSGHAWANIGFIVEGTSLEFLYQKGGGGQGSFGQINVSTMISSSLLLQQFDLGQDSGFGGGDDTLIDLAKIGDSTMFDINFTGDVFKNGSNDFSVLGTLTIGDVNSPPNVVEGDFSSDFVSAHDGFFSLTGGIFNPDGLLQSEDGGQSWVFHGVGDDTPSNPNADGVVGTVTLEKGRSSFQTGLFVAFQFVGDFGNGLDDFFNEDQSSKGANVQVVIVPAPPAMLLGLIGFAGAWMVRRRMIDVVVKG